MFEQYVAGMTSWPLGWIDSILFHSAVNPWYFLWYCCCGRYAMSVIQDLLQVFGIQLIILCRTTTAGMPGGGMNQWIYISSGAQLQLQLLGHVHNSLVDSTRLAYLSLGLGRIWLEQLCYTKSLTWNIYSLFLLLHHFQLLSSPSSFTFYHLHCIMIISYFGLCRLPIILTLTESNTAFYNHFHTLTCHLNIVGKPFSTSSSTYHGISIDNSWRNGGGNSNWIRAEIINDNIPALWIRSTRSRSRLSSVSWIWMVADDVEYR